MSTQFTDGVATFLLAPAASSTAQCVWLDR
jgi:hypothetical protein